MNENQSTKDNRLFSSNAISIDLPTKRVKQQENIEQILIFIIFTGPESEITAPSYIYANYFIHLPINRNETLCTFFQNHGLAYTVPMDQDIFSLHERIEAYWTFVYRSHNVLNISACSIFYSFKQHSTLKQTKKTQQFLALVVCELYLYSNR